MKRMLFALCLLAWVVAAIGCAHHARQGTRPPPPPKAAIQAPAIAPVHGIGEKPRILLLCDRGDPATMDARQFQYRQELGPLMESDLLKRLNRAGYVAAQIQRREEFKPGPNCYLLVVKIDKYNPGSKAARIVVGFGAGTTSLDNSYQLFGSDHRPIMSWPNGCASSLDWKRLLVKLNTEAVEKIQGQVPVRR